MSVKAEKLPTANTNNNKLTRGIIIGAVVLIVVALIGVGATMIVQENNMDNNGMTAKLLSPEISGNIQ